ncbi:TIGR03086 family metal-binding protein [Gordonia sp. SL306]|uniref:TIGR03086 family metal-binding protein n=1 Tax=Gordonia sp. SL306 TaxID=2995145 RepID=UPI002271BD09|nr:TIGR03086 family metal-binding protein [Gordonia sp. SL306]WAC57846.1 TIGR03086 family metal-binding protein [Gordonia sp. SL306]
MRTALNGYAALLAAAAEIDGFDRPSGCAGWTVADVADHVITVTEKFTRFAAGGTDTPRSAPVRIDPRDHRYAFDRAAQASLAAWTTCDPGRTCRLPFGTFSAGEAAGINMMDLLVHGWDVAVGIGLSYRMPEPLLPTAITTARRLVTPDSVARGLYSTPIATIGREGQALLLAITGRQPLGQYERQKGSE